MTGFAVVDVEFGLDPVVGAVIDFGGGEVDGLPCAIAC